MKKLLFLIAFALSITTQAQNFDNYCTENQFPAMFAYVQPKGIGLEVGMWPQDIRFGYFAGILLSKESYTYQKDYETNPEQRTEWQAGAYAKGMYRFNRYFYATAVGGIIGLKAFAAGGLLVSVPIGSGSRMAVIAEPQYGTRGFNIKAGIGLAL